jgi:hypothetical protein
MAQQQLDVVTVAIALATLVFGPATAEIVGPYSVIFLGAVGGASWSAAQRPPSSRGRTLGYMSWMVGLALIATVPLAELAAHWSGLNARWMFAPIAVLVAARPAWVLGQLRRVVERRTGHKEQP